MFEVELTYKPPYTAQSNPYVIEHRLFLIKQTAVFSSIKTTAEGNREILTLSESAKPDKKLIDEIMLGNPLIAHGIATYKIINYTNSNLSQSHKFVTAVFLQKLLTRKKEEILGLPQEKENRDVPQYPGYYIEWCSEFLETFHLVLASKSYINTVAKTYIESEHYAKHLAEHQLNKDIHLKICKKIFVECVRLEQTLLASKESNELKKIQEALQKIREHALYKTEFQSLEMIAKTATPAPTNTASSTPITNNSLAIEQPLQELENAWRNLKFDEECIAFYTDAIRHVHKPEFSDLVLIKSYGGNDGQPVTRHTSPLMNFSQNACNFFPKLIRCPEKDYRQILFDVYHIVTNLRANLKKLANSLQKYITNPEAESEAEDMVDIFLLAVFNVANNFNKYFKTKPIINKEPTNSGKYRDRAFIEHTEEINSLHRKLLELVDIFPKLIKEPPKDNLDPKMLKGLVVIKNMSDKQSIAKLILIIEGLLTHPDPLFCNDNCIIDALSDSVDHAKKKAIEKIKMEHVRKVVKQITNQAFDQLLKKSVSATNDTKANNESGEGARPGSFSARRRQNSLSISTSSPALGPMNTRKDKSETLSVALSLHPGRKEQLEPLSAKGAGSKTPSEPNTPSTSVTQRAWNSILEILTARPKGTKPIPASPQPQLRTFLVSPASQNRTLAAAELAPPTAAQTVISPATTKSGTLPFS